MATLTFNQRADSLLVRMNALKARLQEASSPVVKAPVVEPIRPTAPTAAAVAAAAAPVAEITADAIPKYASPQFAELTQKQQRFVRKVINMVSNENGINMAEITNPLNDGIPFPKEDFPGKKFGDVIRIYTILVKEGDNLFIPPEKSSKSSKKASVKKTLKSVEEFKNDFAEAISAILDKRPAPQNWGDDSNEVEIHEVLIELGHLAQYDINESDPCASLALDDRFLINDRTGKVSLNPVKA